MNSVNDLKNLNKTSNPVSNNDTKLMEPEFVKEGTLHFFSASGNDTLGVIDIEIADDDAQRQQGLMYRTKMKDNQGMLFVFDKSELQNFWMKNTIISLDIIYVDEDFNIVTIHRNTEPYSESQIPSFKKAKYVVEVNAGYCSRHQINEGDRIHSTTFDIVKVAA